MIKTAPGLVSDVHCRIGNLERVNGFTSASFSVHCRIGSLEIRSIYRTVRKNVHCRIGSLETAKEVIRLWDLRSLPHRQLRNRDLFLER